MRFSSASSASFLSSAAATMDIAAASEASEPSAAPGSTPAAAGGLPAPPPAAAPVPAEPARRTGLPGSGGPLGTLSGPPRPGPSLTPAAAHTRATSSGRFSSGSTAATWTSGTSCTASCCSSNCTRHLWFSTVRTEPSCSVRVSGCSAVTRWPTTMGRGRCGGRAPGPTCAALARTTCRKCSRAWRSSRRKARLRRRGRPRLARMTPHSMRVRRVAGGIPRCARYSCHSLCMNHGRSSDE
mmetsp:Transcript_570/g.1485  ORF Transcript_570/g.1485 Transcript_570/m.1485 type:complete len:240 (+) Transcript_570:158-877(+)